MNILISGWYGYGNTGDELLLDLFLSRYADEQKITVLTQGSIDIARAPSIYHSDLFRFDMGGIKQWLRGKPFKLIYEIFKTDIFVLGGGGIIRESGNFTNLYRLLDEVWLAKFFGKRVFIYGVSIGPIASKKGLEFVRKTLLKCDFITVRDRKSVEYLKMFEIDKSKYSLFPDPVFLQTQKKNTVKIPSQLKGIVFNKKIVPIFLSLGLVDDGNNFEILDGLSQVLDKVSSEMQMSFVAIPFRKTSDGSIDDMTVALELKERLENKDCLVCLNDSLDCDALSYVMGQSRLVLAVRLHSMILSIANNTPFIAINYDTKVRDSAIMAGLDKYVIDLDGNFKNNLYEKFIDMNVNYSKIKEEIISCSKRLSSLSEGTFKELDNLIALNNT